MNWPSKGVTITRLLRYSETTDPYDLQPIPNLHLSQGATANTQAIKRYTSIFDDIFLLDCWPYEVIFDNLNNAMEL